LNFLAIRRAGILACFFLLALVNCGGGGGGGGDDGGGLVVDFAPACLSGDLCYAGSVTMQKGAVSGSVFEVQVVLNKLNTIIGAASLFVGFDPTLVDYQGFTKGPALRVGSTDATYLLTEGTGELEISITPVTAKSLTSAQTMITLTFKALKAGSSNLTFKDSDILDGSALYAPAPGPIILLGADGWSGGLATAS